MSTPFENVKAVTIPMPGFVTYTNLPEGVIRISAGFALAGTGDPNDAKNFGPVKPGGTAAQKKVEP